MIQSEELFKLSDEVDLLNRLKAYCLSSDCQRLDEYLEIFGEHAEHIQEICKMLYHISPSKDLANMAKSNENSLTLYSPQLITACQGLSFHPASRSAQIKLEQLSELWLSLFADVLYMSCEVKERIKGTSSWPLSPNALRRSRYANASGTSSSSVSTSNLPSTVNPPVSSNVIPPSVSPFPTKRVTIADDPLDPSSLICDNPMAATAAAAAVTPAPPPPPPASPLVPGESLALVKARDEDEEEELRLTQCATEEVLGHSRWPDSKDNDIVKRAKQMSVMALSMFQFTRGEGTLKTTQDLFTQAEFFAEEANKFYKIVRHFTYQVSYCFLFLFSHTRVVVSHSPVTDGSRYVSCDTFITRVQYLM